MENAIAIIGMAGRFPGAENLQTFWANLCEGKETISSFSEEELIAAGIPKSQIESSNYVQARGILNGIEFFDANFFGMSAKEAEITDPQHRLFLECAWESLENAGYSSDNYQGSIGVYGGTSMSTYFLHHIHPNQKIKETTGDYLIQIGNEKDFLTTRVSYKLNLKGPSISIQTACSTSLVAVSVACNHLLTYQCDMALAGGVSISVPQTKGYVHQGEMIFSPDGHCKPFDASAQGTVPSNGAGVVVLKRLQDAIEDGDHIVAVIRGYGLNNDGNDKIGYAAPSVSGQAEAISSAISMADIDPETITYVEAHGTGTIVGDPIEIQALTQVFAAHTRKKQYCAIGSVKSNIGHLMEAAGIIGLIKTALSLYYKKLPPTLHYTDPNPNIDFLNTPFYVNTQLKNWNPEGIPRRACISSFGIGGTNAHVLLEEWSQSDPISPSQSPQLLVLSAKSLSALSKMRENLSKHLQTHPTISLADVAYTLRVGRKEFAHKKEFVCRNAEEAIAILLNPAYDLNNPELVEELKHSQQKQNRIPLPTYPFEKRKYWIDPQLAINPTPQENHKKQIDGTIHVIEKELLVIWEEILGSKHISLHDDFFQLGGDSLLAVQVLSRIQEVFKIPCKMRTLYEFPTVSQLALQIFQYSSNEKENTLIRLKNGTEDKFLFFIHAIDGNVFSYKPLAESIKFTGSIYAIQTNRSSLQAIEEIASSYIQMIRKIQPHGPYSLFGSSFGGILAYEMARQLKESGHSVDLLGMLDILNPNHNSMPEEGDLPMLSFLLELLEGKETEITVLKHLNSKEQVTRLIGSMGFGTLPFSQQEKIYDQIKLHWKALYRYHPKPYPGKIIFFEAKEKCPRMKNLSFGTTWKSLAKGGVVIHEIPGNHLNMLTKPFAEMLATYLTSLTNSDNSIKESGD